VRARCAKLIAHCSPSRYVLFFPQPINPEAWRWYADVGGDGRVPIVDTYWQTETGGHILTPLPGATPTKPGSATFPFFGVEPLVLHPESGAVLEGNGVDGVLALKRPFPGICRSIYGDHARYLLTYMTTYPGLYFTGDGVHRDADGYYWITGRVDDVVNVSGHRIGSAEVESALVMAAGVAEAAVVGVHHDLKGQALFAYVTAKEGVTVDAAFIKSLALSVRAEVGGFAVPDHILVTAALPKTRSGKIMRRLLRKVACQETADGALGDTSTLADESVLVTLIGQVNALLAAKK
jgi:acetyl-CoA synthetase